MTKVIYLKEVVSSTEVHTTMPSDASNPCLNCGACCAHYRVSFYFAETSDHPEGVVPSELTEQVDSFRACMKGTWSKEPRCIALIGEVGKEISCSIYSKRPSVCKAYNVWDDNGQPNPDCQKLRAALGLSALLANSKEVQNKESYTC